ncbi:hypothetical protein [Candidatus Oscillochloris fontis]|uniref:hypothetical protein n=1 Tax=Candidatus Oscillochloris fontis TaxID=2496868 RepID=UPI00101D9FFE|nr:hypothetical protein [Candidatus Oscillochloris fontis]
MRRPIIYKSHLAGGGELALRLTRCADTWLATPPDDAEQARIAAATQILSEQRSLAHALHQDEAAFNTFCLELFREATFAPLHISATLIGKIIAKYGEPPVVESAEDEASFSDYLRHAVHCIATPNNRRFLATQLRRTLPIYTQAERWHEAIAIDSNTFRTSLGHEVTPFLAQMTLAGLADYYDVIEAAES